MSAGRTLLLVVTWLYRYTSECGVMPCICEAAAKVSGLTAFSFSSSSEDIEGSLSWEYSMSEGILHGHNGGKHKRKQNTSNQNLSRRLLLNYFFDKKTREKKRAHAACMTSVTTEHKQHTSALTTGHEHHGTKQQKTQTHAHAHAHAHAQTSTRNRDKKKSAPPCSQGPPRQETPVYQAAALLLLLRTMVIGLPP